MKYLLGGLLFLFFVDLLSAQTLPSWSPEERERLRKGEQIPGSELLVDDPEDVPLPRVAPEPEVPSLEPVVPEEEYDPEIIPQDYLPDYFASFPENYLIDPQRLLSKQESLDREGFLEYHAEDSKVAIKMYLFDAQQEIPPPHTLQNLVSSRYSGKGLTAVVFYFLGDPSRNLLAFGGEGASEVLPRDVRKILEGAKIKAMEKSDPSTQVESFIVQLSIKLYWLEKALSKVASAEKSSDPSKAAAAAPAPPVAPTVFSKLAPHFLYVAVGASGLVISLLGVGAAWVLWRRSRVYHFPVLELPRRLGADYAAGVGAVMAFHDPLGSPSSQRDQVPDYLTRM